MKKTLLKFTVSHPDPKIEKQGEKALKDLVKTIGDLFGEEVKFYNSEEEARAGSVPIKKK